MPPSMTVPNDAPSPSEESPALALANAVAEDAVRIAQMLQKGHLVDAMDQLIVLVDALGDFLRQVGRAADALARSNPQLSRACLQYQRRLDSVVERVEATLAQRDLVGLALALQRGAAPALRDYGYFDAPLSGMLEPIQRAA